MANSKRTAAITALLVIVAAFGTLLYSGIDSNVVYFLTPNELLAKGTDGYDRPVRLGGQVKPASVKWDSTSSDLRFVIQDTAGTGEITVVSKGTPPQMFRDGMGVVVVGSYGKDGVFQCTSLMIKHSNEYRAPKPGEKPQEMYKSLMKGAGP